MDVLTKKQRSHCMSRISSKNTKPELILRKLISSGGIRGYRLHRKVLGRPDLYFGKKKIAVFIDGCFWHGCPHCYIKPKNNSLFWSRKRRVNRVRDMLVNRILRKQGIKVVRFWEHQIRQNPIRCIDRIHSVLKEGEV